MEQRKKSLKPVKALKDILLPFEITFPVTISIGVNRDFWEYPANQRVVLTYSAYEVLSHSSYAKYLGH